MLTGDDIMLQGNITANGKFKIREDGSIVATDGEFGGYLRTGIDAMQDAPQETIDTRRAFRYVLSRVANLYASGGNYDIYLPHDPEFIGTHITIVFDGVISDNTGYRRDYNPNGGSTLRLFTGRALVKHAYDPSPAPSPSFPNGAYEGNAYEMKRPFYSSVGIGDYELQNLLWFMGVEPVELTGQGYYNPSVLELPEGSAIQLMGVPALQARGVITQAKYKIDPVVGAIAYNGDTLTSTPIIEGEDPDYTGEAVPLCQWAVVAVRGNIRHSYRSGDYAGWGFENTQDYIAGHVVTTTTTTEEPT